MLYSGSVIYVLYFTFRQFTDFAPCGLFIGNKYVLFYPGEDPGGGGAHPARAQPLKLEKIWFFWRKIVIFHMKYRTNFRASLRNFLSTPPLTWNPGSAPVILNIFR